jgi:hypothetical protein
MTDTPEKLALMMGLDIPDFDRIGYYGAEITHTGRLGQDLTTDQVYQAARQTGLNVLGGIKQAVGRLDRVKSIVRTQNFVVCTPENEETPKVSSGLSDLLVKVFGRDRGLGGRATIGVMALANGVCFETWTTVELTDDPA